MKFNYKFVFFPFIGIVILHLLLSIPIKIPIIWPDEYIYLFMAKYFSGEQLTQGLPKTDVTGSFGYSLLISPAFKLFKDPISIYKTVLVFNSIFSGLLYTSIFIFLKKITESSDKLALLISLIVCFYPAYLLQSNNAYTDSLTPAYFLFCITALHQFLIKKDNKSLIIFAILTGFMNWIHIRMLPLTLLSIVVIIYLFYKRQINPIQVIISIGTISLFLLFSIIINDHIQYAMQGNNLVKNDRMIYSLLNIAEVILLISLIGLISYSIINKKIYLLLYIISGFLIGLFLSYNILIWVLLPIVLFINLKYIKYNNNKLKATIYGLLILLIIASMTMIAVPELKYFMLVLQRLKIWFININGVAYYSIFSSYLFVLIGFIGILLYLHNQLWDSGLPENPDLVTDFSSIRRAGYNFELLTKDPKTLTISYMLIASIGMIIITIFPNELTAEHYRADHLFYGRYIEVIIAGYFAFGLHNVIISKAKDYMIILASTIFIFFTMSFLMIYVYGNVIGSELSFKSVLSFFPLRAVLGNINLFIFSTYASVIGIAFALFNRFKPVMASILFAIGLLTTSIFTYYYVDYYYQIDKLERNKLITILNEDFKNIDTINYDLSIFNEKSQNGLNYIWLMPDKFFNLFKPSDGTQLKSEITIGSENYGINNSKNSYLYAVEHDGKDCLWIEDGELLNKLKGNLPLYYNIPLNKEYVYGVYRSKFYPNNWINGKWELIVPNVENDTNVKFELILACSDDTPHNLIVWLDDKEIFNNNILKGEWKYDISFQSKTILNRYRLRFFSDLTKNSNNEIEGIKLRSIKIVKDSIDKIYNFAYNKNLSNTIKMELRRNLDYSKIKFIPGDTIELPFLITNYGNNTIDFDKGDFRISNSWYGFIFKIKRFQNYGQRLEGKLQPGEAKEYNLKIIVPETPKKYFVDFDILNNKNQPLFNIYNRRQWLIDLRAKKLNELN